MKAVSFFLKKTPPERKSVEKKLNINILDNFEIILNWNCTDSGFIDITKAAFSGARFMGHQKINIQGNKQKMSSRSCKRIYYTSHVYLTID